LQYAAAHRNFPGKYLIELPLYLFPWTLLVIAAARRAWRQRQTTLHDNRAVRFALAASLPPLLLLSLAATARKHLFRSRASRNRAAARLVGARNPAGPRPLGAAGFARHRGFCCCSASAYFPGSRDRRRR